MRPHAAAAQETARCAPAKEMDLTTRRTIVMTPECTVSEKENADKNHVCNSPKITRWWLVLLANLVTWVRMDRRTEIQHVNHLSTWAKRKLANFKGDYSG